MSRTWAWSQNALNTGCAGQFIRPELGRQRQHNFWASSSAQLVSPKTMKDLVSTEGSYPEDEWFPSTNTLMVCQNGKNWILVVIYFAKNPNFTKPHLSILKTISRVNTALFRNFTSFSASTPWKSLILSYLPSQARWELISQSVLSTGWECSFLGLFLKCFPPVVTYSYSDKKWVCGEMNQHLIWQMVIIESK